MQDDKDWPSNQTDDSHADTPGDPPTDTPAPLHSAIQSIDFDLACVRCGYNLRGASATGSCPECGEPVETTLRPDLLHMADVDWLGKLRKGSQWLVIAIIMSLAMIPVRMVIGFALAFSNPNALNSGTLPLGATVGLSVLGLFITYVYAVGVWNLSEPEPDKIEKPTAVLLMRCLIIPAMVVGLFPELLNYSGQTSLLYAAAAIDFIGGIAMFVGFLAGLWYLRTLAERIPEPSLAKQTQTVYWGYMISMSITIFIGFAVQVFALSVSNPSSPVAVGVGGAFGLAMCPVVLGLLVFVIWGIVLVFRYRTRFSQAHEIALSEQNATA